MGKGGESKEQESLHWREGWSEAKGEKGYRDVLEHVGGKLKRDGDAKNHLCLDSKPSSLAQVHGGDGGHDDRDGGEGGGANKEKPGSPSLVVTVKLRSKTMAIEADPWHEVEGCQDEELNDRLQVDLHLLQLGEGGAHLLLLLLHFLQLQP